VEDPFAPLPTPPGNNSHPPGNDRELAISIETSVRDGLLANLMERVQNYKNWEVYNAEQRSALMSYRQDLIDIEKQEGFPYYIVWPQPPF